MDKPKEHPIKAILNNLTKRFDMLRGHYFGEENMLAAIKPDLPVLQQMHILGHSYEITCHSLEAELLIFDAWQVAAVLKTEPRACILMEMTFKSKIPGLSEYKPTFVDNYNNLLDSREL